MTSTLPIFDGHNDALLRLYTAEHDDSFLTSTHGHIDLSRAREGGFAGGFFAVFVPAPPDAPSPDDGALPDPLPYSYALQTALGMTALLFRIESQFTSEICVARTVGEIEYGLQTDTLSVILHLEGADPIDTKFHVLEVLYQAGLRSLGIVWSRPNAFGCGVPFRFPQSPDIGPGLTDAGRELVKACNRLGILIDLSHLNEAGFWDVAQLSDAPLVATHSNAYAICPSPRNLTDRQLDAIRESEGMVGVNFHVGFLRPDGQRNADTPLEVVTDHVVYLVERLGIDHVGFGSDFDGALMPNDLGDVAGLPRLLEALRRRGFDEPSLRKLAHENWLRVLRKTWRA
ncbi:dipeptidase [Roseiflexus sp.]|uniref:dipeptidase n=1 Tax=Roseiflexus sp. TaxID=2562120 RepID=UPI00398A8232